MNDCEAELSTDLMTSPKGKQVTSKNTHFSVNGVSTRLSNILLCHATFNLLLPDNREKCDVTLPWQHYFWMTTKPTTTATARRTAKSNMFILTNNNFARASRYFVDFLPLLHHYDMKLPNFTSPLYGVDERNTKIVHFIF